VTGVAADDTETVIGLDIGGATTLVRRAAGRGSQAYRQQRPHFS
jgi:hypothetical protein